MRLEILARHKSCLATWKDSTNSMSHWPAVKSFKTRYAYMTALVKKLLHCHLKLKVMPAWNYKILNKWSSKLLFLIMDKIYSSLDSTDLVFLFIKLY